MKILDSIMTQLKLCGKGFSQRFLIANPLSLLHCFKVGVKGEGWGAESLATVSTTVGADLVRDS